MDSISSAPIPLPSHISPPNHQLSGHVFGQGKNKFGLLKDFQTSRLLKPIVDERGTREYEFYKTVWNSDDGRLKSFVPKFYGLLTIEKVPFFQLEDVTEGLINPSNMDIKMGIITYDPGADSNKIKEEMSKCPWQEVTGFRICGARIHNPTKATDHTFLDKYVTRQLQPKDIPDALDLFLGSSFNTPIDRMHLCKKYLTKLRSIAEWFNTTNINGLKFLSSSLLFVHSSDGQTVILKMIDFAHVFPIGPTDSGKGECKDDNYIFGLNNLINYFEILFSKLMEQSNSTNC